MGVLVVETLISVITNNIIPLRNADQHHTEWITVYWSHWLGFCFSAGRRRLTCDSHGSELGC